MLGVQHKASPVRGRAVPVDAGFSGSVWDRCAALGYGVQMRVACDLFGLNGRMGGVHDEARKDPGGSCWTIWCRVLTI